MVRDCLRNKTSFAIVTILPEGATDLASNFPFANIGTLVNILDADVTAIGLIMIRCVGQHRVKIHSFAQEADGLVVGQVSDVPNDVSIPVPEDLNPSVKVLKQLLKTLADQDLSPKNMPVVKPYEFENAVWVSNRWVELLNLPLLQKQRLMQMESPILRLELIQDILDANKIA